MIFARMFICFKKGGRGSKCLIWNFFEQNIRDTLTNINIFCWNLQLKKSKTFLKFLFRWFKWALKFSRFFVSSNQNKTDFLKKLGQDQITDHTIYNYLALAATSCRSVFFFINWMLNSGGMGKRNPGLLYYPLPLLNSLK